MGSAFFFLLVFHLIVDSNETVCYYWVTQQNQGDQMTIKAISYTRVSTDKQGKSGYGLEDQKNRIIEFCASESMEIVAEFCDVDSGGKDDRPQLMKAIALAKETGAKIVCARLCRLSRSAHFITGLIAHGVPFIVAEFGNVPTFQLHLYAILGEEERRRIGENTKKALAVAKSNGVKLGTHNPAVLKGRYTQTQKLVERMTPFIQQAEDEGCFSLREKCAWMNEREIWTSRGKAWRPATMSRLLQRL